MRTSSYEDYFPLRGRWLRIAYWTPVWVLFLGIGLPSMIGPCAVTMRANPKAQVDAARTQLASFAQAVEDCAEDNGGPPTTKLGLRALLTPPVSASTPKGRKIYLADVSWIPKDPWSNPYEYQRVCGSTHSFRITCFGRDGVPGGTGLDADITVTGASMTKR